MRSWSLTQETKERMKIGQQKRRLREKRSDTLCETCSVKITPKYRFCRLHCVRGTGTTGRIISEETRQKLRDSHIGLNKGEKHARWKGGYQNRLFHNKLRIARNKGAAGSHTFADWENLKAQYNWTCPCCGLAEPDIKLTEDHIIPISKGGSNNIENIQPLCRLCNNKKYTKIIKYNPPNLR